MTEDDIKFFENANVDNITVSLDGTDKSKHDDVRGKGSFDSAKRAINMLKESTIPLTVSMTIHENNIDELEKFIIYCDQNDISAYTSPMFPLGRCTKSNLKNVSLYEIFNRIKKLYDSGIIKEKTLNSTFLETVILPLKDLTRRFYCGSAMSTIFLDSNGNIFPCANTVGVQRFRGGNIVEDSFEDIWLKSKEFNDLRFTTNIAENGKCKKCDLRYICAGYCRGMTYQVTNDINERFVWCKDIHKCLIEGMWTISEHPNLFENFKDKFNRYDLSV